MQLTVNQASPVTTWATPAPVAAGTALSATQLDATANVGGSFNYSPAAGTVMAAGTQQLTAVFSPTDSTDYASATAHASLVVKAPASGSGGGSTGPIGPPSRPTLTGCGGPTVNVNSNMSQSTLQSAIQDAPHCAFVLFAAGTYTITAPIYVPCSVSLGGPPVAWARGDVYTAKITSSVSAGSYPLNFPSCSTAASVQYLSCYGGRPSPDGGGCFYVAAGASNLTVTENYLYGNQGNTGGGNYLEDSLLYFDGSKSATVDSNDTVTWNQFGQQGDCSNLMSNYSYSGLSGNGGFCNGLGIHDGMSNLNANYNIFSYMEQGMKVFENQGECVNCSIEYNDFNNIHRINFETQANIGGSQPTSMFIRYNSIHDQYDTNYGAWGFSAANGCNSGCVTNTDYNVLINNIQAVNGGQYTPGAIEIWGSNGTTDNYNLVQGYWANGLDTSSTGQFVENNNTFCMAAGGSTTAPGTGGYFQDENENPQSYTPTATGNTFSSSPTCAQTSVAPTISPASGTFTGSQTVTFTASGSNRDTNTGVWYTTDGSTPVPGSGTAQYIPERRLGYGYDQHGQSSRHVGCAESAVFLSVRLWIRAQRGRHGKLHLRLGGQAAECEKPICARRSANSPGSRSHGGRQSNGYSGSGGDFHSHRSCASSRGYREHSPIKGDRNLPVTVRPKTSPRSLRGRLQTAAPSQQLLPGRFQAWPRVRRSSPAATRDYKPQPRPPVPSAKWSGAVQS